MSTKFSLLIDCDLLKAMTSTNRPTTSGFVFVDVLAFRMSKSINKPNFVEINGQHNINLWLRYNDFWFEKKTNVHYWSSTSGSDLDHFTVICILFCISLLNFVPNRSSHCGNITSYRFIKMEE